MRILLIEDEVALANTIAQLIKNNKYDVDCAYDGETGYDLASSNIYDLIIADIMLPKVSGLELTRKLRQEGMDIPILLLTALAQTDDKIKGLDAGADDYLCKPFETNELLARIRALLRRRPDYQSDNLLYFEDIKLDPSSLLLYCNEDSISLTKKETLLLEFLILNKNIVSSKEMILEKLWGFDSEAEYNHVEVYISFLRKKLTFLNTKTKISTVRNAGYILKES